jgi:hypothetical protein
MRRLIAHLLCFVLTVVLPGAAIVQASQGESDGLSSKEFARLINDFSEEGGYFMSDNFTSSEDSYLTILGKVKELGVTGGAYIGVGPEQNFTYIAAIRPRIAFIVDIRRQAMIQQLMYKAIFHLSPTRVHFLSLLLGRPVPEGKGPGPDASINEIVAFFSNIQAEEKAYKENLAAFRKTIQEEFTFPLSADDQSSLEYVYGSFCRLGFNVGFDAGSGRGRTSGGSPDLKELLLKKDLAGKQGNFLANKEDYDFVRNMQRKNLVIPVVGDFAGKKALAAVGDYLRKKKLTVSVFYVSNVEIVLLDWNSFQQFSDFVRNVRNLPTNDSSLLMRSTFEYYNPPARLPGYQFCTFLQKVSVFLKSFDEGRYRNYQDLITTRDIISDKR